MSANLANAFKFIFNMQAINATIERLGDLSELDVKIAPSNYFRDFNSIEEIPVTGNEFVIESDQLIGTDYEDGIKRGDLLTSTQFGELVIDEIRPMMVMGTMVGYRIRTSK